MYRDALRAKAFMLGHRRGCEACGWTGRYKELKSRRAHTSYPKPVCTCPNCGLTVMICQTLLYPANHNL